MKRIQIDFFDDLFEKEEGIHPVFYDLRYADSGQVLYQSENQKVNGYQNLKNVFFIKFFPDYLKPTINDEPSFKVKNHKHVKGYAINIEGFLDIETYIKHQFKANSKTVRRYVNRLESCFNISYKLYFGEIEKQLYDLIFDTLHTMLSNRFQQRKDKDQSQKRWNRVRKETFELINAKRASLFVIYEGEKPIEISINYHFKDVLHSSISSYDIDYAKFGLGHVEIYKQVEWCIANNYKIFEMGRGDLDYKRRWSNLIYDFEYLIIYPKNLLPARAFAQVQSLAIQLKLYIKSKNLHKAPSKFTAFFQKDQSNQEHNAAYNVTKMEDVSINIGGRPVIDINEDSHSFLRRGVYDLLYMHGEYLPDLEIYEIEHDKAYTVKGKKGIYELNKFELETRKLK